MPHSVSARAPGKINPVLRVGSLLHDGYHELFTIFQALDVYETLSVTEASEYSLSVGGDVVLDQVPLDDDNVVVKAARALALAGGHSGGARIHIDKRIPVGGGMGGGSADAAAALVALNELWGVGFDTAALHQLAAPLGADVPFSVLGGTALGQGRGGDLEPLVAGEFHWVLVPTSHHLSTPLVYQTLDRLRGGGIPPLPTEPSSDLVAALARGDAYALAGHLRNDMAPAALTLHPELAQTLAAGEDAGAVASMVSGSGPTCAFLAHTTSHQQEIVAGLQARGYRALATRSVAQGAHLV